MSEFVSFLKERVDRLGGESVSALEAGLLIEHAVKLEGLLSELFGEDSDLYVESHSLSIDAVVAFAKRVEDVLK